MSDEEEYEEEEIEEEEEVEEEAPQEEAPAPAAEEPEEHHEAPKEEERKLRPPPPREEEKPPEEMTEAEAAILAARKRKEEEDAHKLLDYEQQRKIEKEKIEEELRELREKQNRRRQERAEEEREFAARAKQAEERRRQEEEAHKQQVEAEKNRRAEEKIKRQQIIAGSLLGAVGTGEGANFVVQKGGGLPGQPDEQKKHKRGPTAEQIAAAKSAYIATISRKPDLENILPNDLKIAIKRLHSRIERIIGETYDLQQRSKRQEYDLKELGDRQLQAQRNKALKMGIDPSEAGDLKHPPKVNVASKFDRQTDRRSYVDRRVLYEKPYVAPEPKIAHGTARPPVEWGRKKGTGVMDEIEQIRKNLEPPKYVEQAPVEGAKPPVAPKPLQIPTDDEPEPAPAAQEVEAEA
jgi:troponin T